MTFIPLVSRSVGNAPEYFARLDNTVFLISCSGNPVIFANTSEYWLSLSTGTPLATKNPSHSIKPEFLSCSSNPIGLTCPDTSASKYGHTSSKFSGNITLYSSQPKAISSNDLNLVRYFLPSKLSGNTM